MDPDSHPTVLSLVKQLERLEKWNEIRKGTAQWGEEIIEGVPCSERIDAWLDGKILMFYFFLPLVIFPWKFN